jgi:hypothetical protein
MSNIRIVRSNESDAATLSSDIAFVSTLPITNLQRDGRNPKGRVLDTEHTMTITYAKPSVLSVIGLFYHNLSTTATWSVTAKDSVDNTLYASGLQSAYEIKSLGDLDWGIDELGASIFTGWGEPFSVIWLDTVISGVYTVDVFVSDPDNEDGHLDYGRLISGNYITPEKNPLWGDLPISWVNTDTQIRMNDGGLRANRGIRFRKSAFDLRYLSTTERSTFFDMFYSTGGYRDILVSLHPDAGASLRRDGTFICKNVQQASAMTPTFYNNFATAFELEES